ncbi:hypothetical protein AVEN_259020-1 [Araneus ventricosus]|uniref:Uncharacterized protein n=1 Tax=Araneus ventricosus TaxID=182803 RepID=A0A4Y2PBC9_ARAVE|nr:hypothetical protein AVEN_259020-1 [Araneus ventricosus]
MSLGYAECPLEVRKSLAAQYFVDAIRDEDTQHSTRLMEEKDLKLSLAYSMKYETPITVSKTSRHVRSIETEDHTSRERDDKFEFFINRLENFIKQIYVVDITDPCILGFLQKFNFTVDLEKNKLRTGGEEIPLYSASVQYSQSCSVLAKKKTIIPARSECLIQGVPEVLGQFRYAVMDFPSQVSQKSVLVAETLVDLEKEVINVRVLNLKFTPRFWTKELLLRPVNQWWISPLVLEHFLEHNIYCQPWRISKHLMKNNEQL